MIIIIIIGVVVVIVLHPIGPDPNSVLKVLLEDCYFGDSIFLLYIECPE